MFGGSGERNDVPMEGVEVQSFGPKMTALTEKQRGYVLAMLTDPLGNPTAWARAAGYADGGPKSALIRKTAHYLAHDDRIMEAAQEEARRHLNTIGPVLGIGVMMQIARSKGHKQQLAAAQALANRAGFHETSEHKVTVDHNDRTGSAMIERIKQVAALLGVDAGKLLGVNASDEVEKIDMPLLIEGEVVK